jgi:hypothetical protein
MAKKEKVPVSLSDLLGSAVSARADPVTKGSVANRLTWESGALTISDTPQRVVIIDGLYSALLAVLPARGTVYTDFAGMSVDSATLIPKKGGLARLTITLVTTASSSGTTATAALREKWEIDSAQIEMPLASHPAIAEFEGAADELEMWRNEPDRALKKAFKYDDGGTEKELTGMVKTFAQKILKGVESYLRFNPVISKTGVYDGRPATAAPGYIGTPTVSVAGFQYLKTADRVVQNDDRTWTRTEQWTGALEWDTDLYTAPS